MNANPVELHSRPNVSKPQSSVFIRVDLKSQRGFFYTQEVTSFANKVEILETWLILYLVAVNVQTLYLRHLNYVYVYFG